MNIRIRLIVALLPLLAVLGWALTTASSEANGQRDVEGGGGGTAAVTTVDIGQVLLGAVVAILGGLGGAYCADVLSRRREERDQAALARKEIRSLLARTLSVLRDAEPTKAGLARFPKVQSRWDQVRDELYEVNFTLHSSEAMRLALVLRQEGDELLVRLEAVNRDEVSQTSALNVFRDHLSDLVLQIGREVTKEVTQ